jgi:opacity protein-like surface antigen
MPAVDSSLKPLVLAALLAAGGAVLAQNGDQWYSGRSTGFWGVGDSVGVRGPLTGLFSPPGSSADSLNAQRQFGGYRITDAFAIEGAQTNFGASASACGGDSLAGDSYRSCSGSGSAWSLSGVATLPFQSGLSLYGRLGLNYRQKGFQEDPSGHRNLDDPGAIGKVYGVGLSYGLTKSITVHAESEYHSDLTGNIGLGAGLGLDSSVHSIGLSVKF